MKAQSRSSSIPIRRSKLSRTKLVGESWTRGQVLRELKLLANPRVREKMAYFGVRVPKALEISTPHLHALARRIGRKQQLAEQLRKSGIHEARILAALIAEAEKATSQQMDRWARDFDAWDVVDACCCYVYAAATPAWQKAETWSRRPEEFVKRAAFSLVACLAYKDKRASDARFERFLRVIEREAHDERNFVRKAVNWALRNIGKRNLRLNRAAIRVAERIRRQNSRSARWIAADALRELGSKAVRARLCRKSV
jgi:3-methyladenine DNA glycosylase AlkD